MVEKGNGSSLDDKGHFEKSWNNLHDRLLRDYFSDDTKTVIIALSRKGPKMVDALFSADEKSKLDIITEFAMPIFFSNLEKGSDCRVFILDDAVYYGSTLLNLYKEVKLYEKLFDVKLSVKAYVAIRDNNALDFQEPEIEADDAWRDGCGHFFVREAMSRFRTLHQSMEVEFPSITYKFNALNISLLEKTFVDSFGDNCYIESYNEGTIVNVVYPPNESQFCKARIYPDGYQIHVTFMAPRVVPNDESILRRLMNNMDESLKKWWDSFCSKMLIETADIKTVESLNRSRHRNIVSLANYIYSYQNYISYKANLESAFRQFETNVECEGLDEETLYQFIGDRHLTSKLIECLYNQNQQDGLHFLSLPTIDLRKRDLHYEEPRNPSEQERRTLESHNWHMIRNSHSYKEALSAIFFNQNLFIERWSRTKARFETRHLWFGYTHDVLMQMLEENGRFNRPANKKLELHRWIDNRIDMGCIVPQYILDYATNQWVRVFRPGENEELLLSHLSRFVIHVYNRIEQRLMLGYVPESFLRNMLAVIYKRFWNKGLSIQFQFRLELSDDGNHLLTLSKGDSEGQTEVIKFLQKMYILENNDGEITIAPRITDEEFKRNTTIEQDLIDSIDLTIKEILDKFEETKTPVSRYYTVFNYYLNEDLTDEQLTDIYHQIARQLLRAVRMIDTGIDIGDNHFVSTDCQNLLLDSYHMLLRYDVGLAMLVNIKKMTAEQYWQLYDKDPRLKAHTEILRMTYILNLLISVYAIGNFEQFKYFTETFSQKNYLEMIGLGGMYKYIDQILSAGSFSEVHTTHKLTRPLQRVIEQIAN